MKLLLINKRRYTGKDVIDDRYGRMWEIPEHLARFGHEVTVQTIKYQPWGQLSPTQLTSPSGAKWHNFYVWPLPIGSLFSYYNSLVTQIRSHRPDIILASSDIPHAVLGAYLARKHEIPLVIDLYDQYESFGASRFPGLIKAFRKALDEADLVTCVTRRLCEWCTSIGIQRDHIMLLGNAVTDEFLHKLDKKESRIQLNLPVNNTILIGTAGALEKNRDIQILYDAFLHLANRQKNLHLVIAGRRDSPPPSHSRIHDLGVLPHKQIPILFSALDIGVVCNANNQFSRYCSPQKLLEMQACCLPAITSDVLDTPDLNTQLQYQTGNIESLKNRIEYLISNKNTVRKSKAPTWEERAEVLETNLLKMAKKNSNP